MHSDKTRIIVLAHTNPKRPGSESFHRFGLYRSGETVEEYVAAGGRRSDVRWDAAHGYIGLRTRRSRSTHPRR